MDREKFIEEMKGLGYSTAGAEDLVWIAQGASEDQLTQAEFNFVPVGAGLYEILTPTGRAGYFKAPISYGVPFRGTLSEAYLYVYKQKARRAN